MLGFRNNHANDIIRLTQLLIINYQLLINLRHPLNTDTDATIVVFLRILLLDIC